MDAFKICFLAGLVLGMIITVFIYGSLLTFSVPDPTIARSGIVTTTIALGLIIIVVGILAFSPAAQKIYLSVFLILLPTLPANSFTIPYRHYWLTTIQAQARDMHDVNQPEIAQQSGRSAANNTITVAAFKAHPVFLLFDMGIVLWIIAAIQMLQARLQLALILFPQIPHVLLAPLSILPNPMFMKTAMLRSTFLTTIVPAAPVLKPINSTLLIAPLPLTPTAVTRRTAAHFPTAPPPASTTTGPTTPVNRMMHMVEGMHI